MADCSEIGLMLGAFEDSELEPHEMQEVAFHLARCDDCTVALAEISALGRQLRTATQHPEPDGFKDSVMTRIEALPIPLTTRVGHWVGRINQRVAAGIAMGAAVAVAAVLTAIIVTPYAQRFAHREIPAQSIATVEKAAVRAPDQLASAGAGLANDSHAVISRLESNIPNVAVWSEPQNDTTVIWLPDQP
jgi:anti-sigma factor RsiW